MRWSLGFVLLVVSGCGNGAANQDMTAAITDMAIPPNAIDAGPAECDPTTTDTCMSGQKCTIGSDHGGPRNICFPIASNPVSEGGTCMPVTMGTRVGDNCAAGLSCIDYAGEGLKCRKPCYGRSECPAGDGCVVLTSSNDTAMLDGSTFPLSACHPDAMCDVVAQTGCPSGTGGCYLSRNDGAGRISVCLMPAKMGMDGAECSHINDCAPGFRCDLFGFCRRYCYYQSPNGAPPTTGQCPSGEGTCQLFPLENDQYGICGAL
jgi:hypothetical protein